MSARALDYWFEFASTYSYLTTMRIEDMARARGITLRWRPFLLGPIFAAQGWTTSPFNLYPAKGRYMWRDMERLCAARGLPLQRPDTFPQNGLNAARLAIAAGADMPAFCRAVYTAQFAEGADISALSTLEKCLETAGLPLSLIERAQSPEVKQALRDQTDTAISLGIFGAPSFTVGKELFWGDDRLDQALDHALRH